MKLAFMTFACPEWSVAQIVDGARRYGYHGVEIRVQSEHAHGIEIDAPAEARHATRSQFADAGIEVPCLATSLQFARSGAAGQAECDTALQLLDLAADMGAWGLRVFGGFPVRDSEDNPANKEVSREEATQWAAENLRRVADEAAARHVHFWFETHDYFRKGAETAAVVRGADHPAVRCNWDVMHPQLNGEDFSVTQQELAGLIEHTHFHDAKSADARTICPFGEGELPLMEMLQWLQAQGYNGYLSAEYFGDSLGDGPDVSLPRWAEGCRLLLDRLNDPV